MSVATTTETLTETLRLHKLWIEDNGALLDAICDAVHYGAHMLDDSEENAQTGEITIDARTFDDHAKFCDALQRLDDLAGINSDHGALRQLLLASP